jgi:GTP cyclohydrolase I
LATDHPAPDYPPGAAGHLEAYARTSVVSLLHLVGENPERDGLIDTPKRVVKAYKELCRGYGEDPAEILSRQFVQDDDAPRYNGVVLLRGIEIYSLCEHHLLPFTGTAHVAYIPGASGKIVGLSKLARLVDCFARRLQVQERLTVQVADAIERHVGALGVYVQIQAEHACMRMRGVGKQHSTMVTSECRGMIFDNPATRAEVVTLANSG